MNQKSELQESQEILVTHWMNPKNEEVIRRITHYIVQLTDSAYIDANDVYQEVFERAFKSPKRFISNKDYFFKNIKNECLNVIRTELKRIKKQRMINPDSLQRGWEHIEKLKKSQLPSIDTMSIIKIDIKNILNEDEYQLYQLVAASYTIREITAILNKPSRHAIDKLKKKLHDYFSQNELDSTALAYYYVRDTIATTQPKLKVK